MHRACSARSHGYGLSLVQRRCTQRWRCQRRIKRASKSEAVQCTHSFGLPGSWHSGTRRQKTHKSKSHCHCHLRLGVSGSGHSSGSFNVILRVHIHLTIVGVSHDEVATMVLLRRQEGPSVPVSTDQCNLLDT